MPRIRPHLTCAVRTRRRLILAATTVALASLMVVAPGASGSFGAATNFGVGDVPYSVAVGDFNADGDLDIATANGGSGANSVSVLLGEAGLTFGVKTDFAVGTWPQEIAVGEFNGDTDPDLAVAYRGGGGDPGGVSVLLGGPGGSFAGANFFAGTNPFSVAVGDFNADADPDLAVANNTSDNVSVLLGGTGGSFGAPTNFAVGSDPFSVAVGDFNGGSDPDLAVASAQDGIVSVLLGGPGGGFGAKTDFLAGTEPVAVAARDFNGDGDPDLAVTNFNPDRVSVLRGEAGGGFGAPTAFVVGPQPTSIATGDFNGDLDPDIATANNGSPSSNAGSLSVLLGTAPSSFVAGGTLTVPAHPSSVAVGDFNGDSRRDLVSASEDDDNVSVLLNSIDSPLITATSPASPANDNNPTVRGSGAEANSSVRLYADSTCTGTLIGQGPADAFNGTGITATNAVAADQTTNLHVTATDAHGNVSPCSAPFPYVEDSTPPNTQIDTSPPNPSSDTTGDFTFSSTGGGTSFQCRVDAGAFSACSSTHATAALSDGPHTFDVRAIDAVGNVDQSPASYAWTVDTIAPAEPSINDTDPDSPANDNSPEVKGSGAEANSVVKIYTDSACSGAVLASGTAAAFNATGITVTVLDDQTTNMWVTATDQANTVSGCSLGFSYTEDSTGPAPPTITDTDPDSPADDNTPEVKGSDAEPGSTVTLYNNIGRSCINPVGSGSAAEFNGATGITVTVAADQITHLRPAATDLAGNTTCSGAFSFPYTEDSTVPAEPRIRGTDPASPANDNDPEVRGDAEAGDTVTLYTTPDCSGTELAVGSASEFADPGLTVTIKDDTTTDFRVTASDNAGHTSACSEPFRYVEDSIPPETQIDTNPPNPSSDTTGDFTFSSTGGGTSLQCRIDDAAFAVCSSPHATAALADGSHTFEVRAVDAAANVDQTPASYTWTVDTIAPAAPSITDTDPDSPANDNAPKVKGSAEANSTVKLYTDDVACVDPADATGSVATFAGAGITVTVAGDQTTQLRARAVDQAGNVSDCSAAFAYTEDSTAPAAPSISDTDPDSPADDNNPEVKGSLGGGDPTQVKLYSDDAGCADPAAATGSAAAFTGAGITVIVVGDHTTQLRARAVDQAGNASACSGAFAYIEDSAIPGTTNPETTITRQPANKTHKKKAKFEFESSKPGSSFACKLDSKPFELCSSAKIYKKLRRGKHTFQVQATDAGGNTDATPATVTWKVKR